MTRDEACKKLFRTGIEDVGAFIDALAALGVLKLDEPKPTRDTLTVPDGLGGWVAVFTKDAIVALRAKGYVIAGPGQVWKP